MNESYAAHTKWVNVRRDLPNKSKVCAIFWERKSDGKSTKHSPACVEIQV